MLLNVLVPMAGTPSQLFEAAEYFYPKPLIEVSGKPMIQLVTENLAQMKRKKQFLFVVRQQDAVEHHLDRVLSLVAPPPVHILQQPLPNKGAVGSCLLAIEHINNDNPLLIVNSDQLLRADLDGIIDRFEYRGADAGVLYYDSIHPKWSYARIDSQDWVLETAEKNPISRNALAGFYYFRRGEYFVHAAMDSILKNSHVNGNFYIAPVMNELILRHLRVAAESIEETQYFSFYSPARIKEYEVRSYKHAC